MRFNPSLVIQYKRNGFIIVKYDHSTKYYDVYIIHNSGRREFVMDTRNKQVAISIAKRVAMERKFYFNKDIHVIL